MVEGGGGGGGGVLSLSPTIQVNTTWDERFLRGELKDVLSFVGHLDSLLNICASKWAALMPDGFWGGVWLYHKQSKDQFIDTYAQFQTETRMPLWLRTSKKSCIFPLSPTTLPEKFNLISLNLSDPRAQNLRTNTHTHTHTHTHTPAWYIYLARSSVSICSVLSAVSFLSVAAVGISNTKYFLLYHHLQVAVFFSHCGDNPCDMFTLTPGHVDDWSKIVDCKRKTPRCAAAKMNIKRHLRF